MNVGFGCPGELSANHKGRFNQSCGLVIVDIVHDFERNVFSFAVDVRHFSSDHAIGAELVG